MTGESAWNLWGNLAPLKFEDYRHTVSRIDSIRKEARSALHSDWGAEREIGPEIYRLLALFRRERHTPTAAGYEAYVQDVSPSLLKAVERKISEANLGDTFDTATRAFHTHVLGGRGAGKSELLKLLLHHHVKNPGLGGVLVLDPHGDLVRDVARWLDFESGDRLVFLDGNAGGDKYPALNPLAIGDLNANEVADYADLLANAVSSLSEKRELSDNMHTMARYCLWVLLGREGSTLADLATFMGNPKEPETAALIEAGKQHPDVQVSRYFRDAFINRHSLSYSKNGIADRLDAVLGAARLRPLLTAQAPINLESLLDAGKIVLVNLAGAGAGGADILGRLLVARMAMIGKRRMFNPDMPRNPVHVFVDEAARLVSPDVFFIMDELRKFRVWLTLAHQYLSQIRDPRDRESLWNGSAIKIIGATDERDTLQMLFGKDVPTIGKFQFAVRWGIRPREQIVLLTETPNHLRDGRNNMTDEAWENTLARQVANYYSSPEKSTATPTSPRRGKMELR